MINLLARFLAPKVQHPLGYWRCTVVGPQLKTFGFEVGKTYECRDDDAQLPRIYPTENPGNKKFNWAPYWMNSCNRFCYDANELDFEYIGATATPAANDQSPSLIQRIIGLKTSN